MVVAIIVAAAISVLALLYASVPMQTPFRPRRRRQCQRLCLRRPHVHGGGIQGFLITFCVAMGKCVMSDLMVGLVVGQKAAESSAHQKLLRCAIRLDAERAVQNIVVRCRDTLVLRTGGIALAQVKSLN